MMINNIDQLEVLQLLGKSNHSVIKFRYIHQSQPTQELKEERLNSFKGDYQNFKNDLKLIDWRVEMQGRTLIR